MASKKKEDQKYFNFPIQLLQDFLVNDDEVLMDIWNYSLYSITLEYEFGNDVEKVQSAKSYLGVQGGNEKEEFKKGKIIFNSIPLKSPMVGLNTDVWFDYYKNDKTEFEKITLLGFLAIKSILGKRKPYCKITNNFWLSRMDGKAKSINEIYELSEPLKKYAVHYQLRKIKSELERNWNLKTVSGRGFNVSFKMSIDALTYEVLKKRKKYKDFEIKKAKDEAKNTALARLYETQP